MKTTITLIAAFSIGIIASNKTIHRTVGAGTMQSVFQFDNLEQQRIDKQQPYLSFLNVDSLHCGIYCLAGWCDRWPTAAHRG